MSAENLTLLILVACFAVGVALSVSGKLIAVLIGFIPLVGAAVLLLAYIPSAATPQPFYGIAILLLVGAWGVALLRSGGNITSIVGIVVIVVCVVALFGYLDASVKKVLEEVFDSAFDTAQQVWNKFSGQVPKPR